MLRTAEAPLSYSRAAALPAKLWRYSRSVEADIFDWGLVVDSFRTSDPATLKDSLTAVYRHPSEARGLVRLVGVEERWLPFGLARTRRQVALDDLPKAISFLESGCDGRV